jgi:cellulose synthase (UDP-forming)
VARGAEPHVGVIIPTCGEAVPMILRTVVSVLEQDWPADRLTVVVSDDGRDPVLAEALAGLPVRYHVPPPRDAPGRDGAAKAGNLNSALAVLDREHPDLAFVETRDADDEVGSNGFLRQTVGQLLADRRLAFVQTIKEAQVSAGDPFNNRESMFYRGQMLARNAANAVFPCGSGLVWRRAALRDIGEFPTWNLVEDVQSGVEALRRGWRGLYLPIVGAVGQHSPEDVPNVYKQRGTWAIDTVRLIVWGDLRGLNRRQRLHFAEMLFFYLNAFTTVVYIPSVVCSLLG